MERYYQPEIETASREQLTAWQDQRLTAQVRSLWDSVPYYRQKMEAAGLTPADIQGIGDLGKLPFMTREDLTACYPFGMLARPTADCVTIHSSAGTTGKKLIAFYTQRDLELWEDRCARAVTAAGGMREDVCQISFGYGLFTGGAGLDGGCRRVGCLTLPMSAGNTDRQLQFMEDLGATILCCTPSYAAYLAECVQERGLKISLRSGIFGAEPWSEEMRRSIEEKLGIKAYDIYGLTELGGMGVAFECSAQDGLHINEDSFIAEVVDPETGEALPEGQAGELVLSAVTQEAMPLLRYRTRDICVLSRAACPCGRTHIKMSKPMGRSDDMLVIKGVNVFPSQIETVLLAQGFSCNYQIIVDRLNGTDTLEVLVEMPPEALTDKLRRINEMERSMVAAMKSALGIRAKVRLVPPKTITRGEEHTVRVVDKRKK